MSAAADDAPPDAAGEEFVTIAEAARRLGIHEKRLRRLLKHPEYADRTRTQERETRTGTRTATVLSSGLIEDIRARIVLETDGDNGDVDGDVDNGDGDRSGTQTGTGTGTNGARALSVSVSVSQIAALYEQRLAAQDRANAAVIAAKDEMIGQLRAQVEDLRQTKDRALEALAREQALRALPAPAPQEAPQAPQAGYGSEGRGLPPTQRMKRPKRASVTCGGARTPPPPPLLS